MRFDLSRMPLMLIKYHIRHNPNGESLIMLSLNACTLLPWGKYADARIFHSRIDT